MLVKLLGSMLILLSRCGLLVVSVMVFNVDDFFCSM